MLVVCRQEYGIVLQQLAKLSKFIPESQHEIPLCADQAKRLHEALAPKVQDIIVAAAHAYAKASNRQGLSVLTQFAGRLEHRVDNSVLQHLNSYLLGF
jgi:hypothetical protein